MVCCQYVTRDRVVDVHALRGERRGGRALPLPLLRKTVEGLGRVAVGAAAVRRRQEHARVAGLARGQRDHRLRLGVLEGRRDRLGLAEADGRVADEVAVLRAGVGDGEEQVVQGAGDLRGGRAGGGAGAASAGGGGVRAESVEPVEPVEPGRAGRVLWSPLP